MHNRIHYAALIRGDIGMKLFLDSMSETGWWPCPKTKCTEDLLKTARRAHDSHVTPSGAEKALDGTKAQVTVALVDNSTSATLTAAALSQFATTKNFLFKHFDREFYLYDGRRACVRALKKAPAWGMPKTGCTESDIMKATSSELAKTTEFEKNDYGGTSAAYSISAEAGKFDGQISGAINGLIPEGMVFFTGTGKAPSGKEAGGYAKVAAARALMREQSASAAARQQWVLVADGKTKSIGQSMQSALDQLTSGAGGADYRIVVSADCRGPWLIKSSEWGRQLMRRAADSWLLREARLKSKSSSHIDETKQAV